jgi:hypothetical protein
MVETNPALVDSANESKTPTNFVDNPLVLKKLLRNNRRAKACPTTTIFNVDCFGCLSTSIDERVDFE